MAVQMGYVLVIPFDGCPLIPEYVKQNITKLQSLGKQVILTEGELINRSYYTVIPTSPYLVKIITITNSSSGFDSDALEFEDISGKQYSATITSEGAGTVVFGGTTYALNYYSSPGYIESFARQVRLNFPQTSTEVMTFYCPI